MYATWLDGRAPIDIAPNLYKWAWRKYRTVQVELCNQSWTKGLWGMNSVTKMAEFIYLWDRVAQFTLDEGQDAIAWKWTASGEYSSKSAYLAQFNGSYSTFNANAI